MLSQYAHLSPITMQLKLGTRVSSGQLIGYSGNSGYSTGPHLHFAILKTYIKKNGRLSSKAIPFKFYAYQPHVIFTPKKNMQLRANYTSARQKKRQTRARLRLGS